MLLVRATGLLISLTLSTLLASPGFAKPVIKENVVYYEFEAKNRKEIWQQIANNSPKGKVNIAGHHAVNVALTEWRIAGNFKYRASLFKCKMVVNEPELTVTIHLPHWSNKWQADQKLAEDWDRYVRLMSTHEDIHKAYAIKMVEELYLRINELGTFKSCDDLDRAYKKLRAEVFAKYRAKNKMFDAQEFVYQKNLRWF